MADPKTNDVNPADVAKAQALAKDADEAGRKTAAEASKQAQKRDAEVLKAMDEMKPYPSQEEADQIRMAAAGHSGAYMTRDAKG